jgi:DNA-binding transcriptional ArsR family regulator
MSAPTRRSRTQPGPVDACAPVAAALRAASDPTRCALLRALDCGPRDVTELCRALRPGRATAVTAPSVSYHLAALRHAGWAVAAQEGRHVVYTLTVEGRRMAEVVRMLMDG